MTIHKRQHFIPQSYLKAWCDSNTPEGMEPYVWQFSKEGDSVRKKAPINIFYENDMYTIEIPGEERNLILEHGLAELESRFVLLRDYRIKNKELLTFEEKVLICAFTTAMRERTKANREHHKTQWHGVLDKMEKMAEWAKTASEQEMQAMASFAYSKGRKQEGLSYNDVKELATHPLQNILPSMIQVGTPLLLPLDLAIFETSDSVGFITSDDPCVWFDPEWHERPTPYQRPALMYPTIEITLPVSPNHVIFLNRQGVSGYISVNEKKVDELNRRTRFHAFEHFIVNCNVKKERWFDPKA